MAAFALAVGLHQHQSTEVSHHQPFLFRPQGVFIQILHGARLFALGTGLAFFLDLLDAPVLATGQFAFTHAGRVFSAR